ncbi:ECF transporter S component [Oceanobacillus halotolerans]|uniref:ECF transporter S component n=1 Tax=Oceanobacillus halotolerans TaxID=2663380 RepID=UPI0013DD6D36|nr:ECF transporter S component [Oceanobacillus halotolerans]
MAKSKWVLICISFIILVILIGFPLWNTRHYILLSFLIMIASFMPFMIRFSKQKITSRELVMLAILGAIAAVSRVPFSALPSVQPTTFVVIVAAIVLGPQSGFVIGVLAAIVSNLFLGQGPWTPWQMYAWGMIGLIAGSLRYTWIMKSMFGRCVYGLVMGFLFGWFMNLWFIIGVIQEVNWKTILLYNSTSFYFDLAHALSNVFFLFLFSKAWIKILNRFKRKYGLFNKI